MSNKDLMGFFLKKAFFPVSQRKAPFIFQGLSFSHPPKVIVKKYALM